MTDVTQTGIEALEARLAGELVLPGHEGWDAARQAWNLAVDQRPAAVVFVESADDVVAVVEFADEHGLRILPQGTGHFASTAGPLERSSNGEPGAPMVPAVGSAATGISR